jgi:hypothetical protein
MKCILCKTLDKNHEQRKYPNTTFWVSVLGTQIRKDELSYPHETKNVH